MLVVRLLQVGGVTGPGVDVLVGALVGVGVFVEGGGVVVVVVVIPHALYGADPAHADIAVVHCCPELGQQ